MDNITQENLKVLRSRTLNQVNQGIKRTYSFRVDYSDIDPTFTGVFTVHHPSQMERLRMGVLKANLLDNQMVVDTATENLAIIMSTLDTVVDAKPDWFDVDNDKVTYEMMEAVYLEYLDWVNSFRKPNRENRHAGSSEDTRSEVPMVDTENIPSATHR